MTLNIHVTSHPIIQYLSSSMTNPKIHTDIGSQRLRQLGLLITYETIRNWIKVYKLTIQQIKEKKEITILDPKESYTIISKPNNQISLLQEVQLLLPKSNIQLVSGQKNHFEIFTKDHLNITNKNTKIIILIYDLDPKYILKLLKYLIDEHDIKPDFIRITCIKCTSDQLIAINKLYPTLNIYTTKIINV